MNVVPQKTKPEPFGPLLGAKKLSRLPWFRAKDLIDEVVLGGAWLCRCRNSRSRTSELVDLRYRSWAYSGEM